MDSRTGITRSSWLSVAAVTFGTFVMATCETLPIGLLTGMAADLGVPEGRMGLTITLPGLIAAVVALVLPLLIGTSDRRSVLIVAVSLLVVGCVGSALTPSFTVLLLARGVAGVGLGMFWGLAPSIAARLVLTADVAKATSAVFAGGSIAAIVGVPLATILGTMIGWRGAFWAVAAVSVSVIGVLLSLVPKLGGATQTVDIKRMGAVASTPVVWTGMGITLLAVVAHFGGFTYASPILQQRSGVAETQIGVYLLIAGVASLIGNLGAAWFVSRSPTLAIVLCTVGVAVGHLGLLTVAPVPVLGFLAWCLWALSGGGIGAAVQGWISQSRSENFEIATSINSAVFNFAIAAGAWLCGVLLDLQGTGALLTVMIGVSVTATAIAVFANTTFVNKQPTDTA